jgi:hypothetical protein
LFAPQLRPAGGSVGKVRDSGSEAPRAAGCYPC